MERDREDHLLRRVADVNYRSGYQAGLVRGALSGSVAAMLTYSLFKVLEFYLS